jgi:hypothetical protein
MKKKLFLFIFTTIFVPAYSIDWVSDVLINTGYVFNNNTPFGFNFGYFGVDFSFNYPINKFVNGEEEYIDGRLFTNYGFGQLSLSYGIKILEWFRIPAGISLYGNMNSEKLFNFNNIGFNVGVEFLINIFNDNINRISIKAQTINFEHFLFGIGWTLVNKREKPVKQQKIEPKPQRDMKHPTLTPEEFQKVEIAYEPAVKELNRQGKHLNIYNMNDRALFIQVCQGNPDTAAVNRAKNAKLQYYSSRETSAEDIVNLAEKETDPFLKARIIHDWVSDIFAYDLDLLSWMDNVSGQNAQFTLGAIINRERGVCYEYAILYCYLMNAAGVDTYLISDLSAPKIGHAYNMVVINDTGYIIDTTWDSGNRYGNNKIIEFKRTVSKKFFMPGISQSYKLRGW